MNNLAVEKLGFLERFSRILQEPWWKSTFQNEIGGKSITMTDVEKNVANVVIVVEFWKKDFLVIVVLEGLPCTCFDPS